MTDWQIFTGQDHPESEDPRARLRDLEAPPWREFRRKSEQPFLADEQTVQMVNAAIYLRRPLLVMGRPGTGKSSLARAVARQLRLEPLLKWPITTKSTLQDGLYRYDALARLRDVQLHPEAHVDDNPGAVARYIRLGPLGTALAAASHPRVLLIDEIDKSDIDLPNDLLHVLEEGEFTIPELARFSEETVGDGAVRVQTDDNQMALVPKGQVQCHHFPIIILTSNGERDFPPAFLRRCIQLEMRQPDEQELREIVRRHLGDERYAQAEQLIGDYVKAFHARREKARGDLATDQLLNLLFLLTRDIKLDERARRALEDKLLARLTAE